MDISEILSHVASVIVGAIGGSFLTLRITHKNRVSGHGRSVDQSSSRVGGDQIGGNKNRR